MLLTVGFGLVATRLSLSMLGPEDFGVLIAISAFTGTLATGLLSLTTSVQRHLAFDLGQGEELNVERTFASSRLLFVLVGSTIWTAGLLFRGQIMPWLGIDIQKLKTAAMVYQANLAAFAVMVGTIPYQALATARQRVYLLGLSDLAGAIFRLCLILVAAFVSLDRLLYLGVVNAISMVLPLAICLICVWKDDSVASAPFGVVSRSVMSRIASFAGWSMLHQVGWGIRQQGPAILLSSKFGPSASSGYGVAMQLGGYVSSLSSALLRVVQPAMAKSEGEGRRDEVRALCLKTSRFSGLLLAIVFTPLFLELDFALKLWLKDVPKWGVEMGRFVLLQMFLMQLISGHSSAIQATGNVGGYYKLTFALAPLCVVGTLVGLWHFRLSPVSVGWLGLAAVAAHVLIAVFYAGQILDVAPLTWAGEVLLPSLTSIAGVVGMSLVMKLLPIPHLVVVMLQLMMSPVVGCALFWWLTATQTERQFIKGLAQRRRPQMTAVK